MVIVSRSVKIIDYDRNQVFDRETPPAFDEYVSELISHINSNSSVRSYKTRSTNTEVARSILQILEGIGNHNALLKNTDIIAQRLLLKERETQDQVSRMNINVQKGSLIQALMHDENSEEYAYLLAKVEHSSFVDDSDYSFKTGFSKDKKTIWKSCLFSLGDTTSDQYYAKVYTNTSAQYWGDNFLELDQVYSDEDNTVKAFDAIETTLNQNTRGRYRKDHSTLRNAFVCYMRNNDHIDYPVMVDRVMGNFLPEEMPVEKAQDIKTKLLAQPEKKGF